MRISDAGAEFAAAVNDWRGRIIHHSWVRRDQKLCWGNYATSNLRIETYGDLRRAVRSQQYSVRFRDDSIARMCYEYETGNTALKRASLSFHKMPEPIEGDEIWDAPEIGPWEDDLSANFDNDLWIRSLRFDYDPETGRGPPHAECHLHIGGYGGTRIATDGVPNYAQFLEFVMMCFFPKDYSAHRLAGGSTSPHVRVLDRLNACAFACDTTERRLPHLKIPTE